MRKYLFEVAPSLHNRAVSVGITIKRHIHCNVKRTLVAQGERGLCSSMAVVRITFIFNLKTFSSSLSCPLYSVPCRNVFPLILNYSLTI